MMTSARARYAGYRFPCEIISHAVWLYFRFPLGLRMVEEVLAARGSRPRKMSSRIFIARQSAVAERLTSCLIDRLAHRDPSAPAILGDDDALVQRFAEQRS